MLNLDTWLFLTIPRKPSEQLKCTLLIKELARILSNFDVLFMINSKTNGRAQHLSYCPFINLASRNGWNKKILICFSEILVKVLSLKQL